MKLSTQEENALRQQIDMPYPERLSFLRELQSDMQSYFDELISAGTEVREAERIVKEKFHLTPDDISELRHVHLDLVGRLLSILPDHASNIADAVLRVVIVSVFITYLLQEVPMVQFLNEGGLSIYVILALGGLMLLFQITRGFRWFVRRDHSPQSLASNTTTPVIAAGLLALVGLSGTALGYYVVFSKWASEQITTEQVKIGLYEPLPCLIVATLLGSVIIVLHWATQSRLKAIGIVSQ